MADFTLAVARRFQMWDFTVGHSQLLLRSTGEERFPTRIDLVFRAVLVVQLPTVLDVLRVTATPANEAVAFLGAWPRITGVVTLKDEWLYTISGPDGVGCVVARFFDHHEDGEAGTIPVPSTSDKLKALVV